MFSLQILSHKNSTEWTNVTYLMVTHRKSQKELNTFRKCGSVELSHLNAGGKLKQGLDKWPQAFKPNNNLNEITYKPYGLQETYIIE